MIPIGAALVFEMARHAPVRTAIFSVGPPLWGLVQLLNAYLHDGALLYVAVAAAVMTAFSVLLTRYHAAAYRRALLAERWSDAR